MVDIAFACTPRMLCLCPHGDTHYILWISTYKHAKILYSKPAQILYLTPAWGWFIKGEKWTTIIKDVCVYIIQQRMILSDTKLIQFEWQIWFNEKHVNTLHIKKRWIYQQDWPVCEIDHTENISEICKKYTVYYIGYIIFIKTIILKA